MKSYRDEIDKIDEAIKKLVKKRLDTGEKITNYEIGRASCRERV